MTYTSWFERQLRKYKPRLGLWTNNSYQVLTNSVAETVVATYTLPAHTMGVKSALYLNYDYRLYSVGGPVANCTRRVYLGSTKLLEATFADGNGLDYWENVSFYIANMGSLTAQDVQYFQFGYRFDPGIGYTVAATAAEDTGTDLVIKMTFQWSAANAKLITTLGYSFIEHMPGEP